MADSQSDLLYELQVLADDLERTPLPDDITEASEYSPETYFEEFGSWYGAAAAADLDRPVWPSVPEKELLGDLQRLKRPLDKMPSEQDVAEYGGYGVSTYWSRFGSWNAAIEAAGWQPNPDRTHRSEEALDEELHRLRDELGHVPTSREMDAHGKFSRVTYRNRWESWNDALEAVGLTPRTQAQQLSRTDLLDELQRLADDLERVPTTTDMADHGAYSHSIYYTRFDSWSAALEADGLMSTNYEA